MMARLHEDLLNTPPLHDIARAPGILYGHATPVMATEAIRNKYFGDTQYAANYKGRPSGDGNSRIFIWRDFPLHVPFSIHMETLKRFIFETFAPPRINPHSLQAVQVEQGDVVVDAGACEGFYTMDCLDKGAESIIISEASIEMRECLSRTFKDKGEIYPALGGYTGKVIIHQRGAGSSVHGELNDVGADSVDKMITLDSLRLTKVDLIKMDIEGSEFSALLGARNTIREHKPKLLIMTYHKYMDAFLIYSLLTSINPDCKFLLWGRQSLPGNKTNPQFCPKMLVAW